MKTPLNNAVQQSNLDASGFKIIGADLSDYAGGGLSWDGQFHSSDPNTVTAADIGLVGDGVTDNTTALQTWFTSLETLEENVTLLVPDGVYIFSGPLQDPARKNAQLILPLPTSPWTLTIKGYHPLSPTPTPAPYGPSPLCSGPVFKSTLATGGGTEPAFINGMGPDGPFGAQSGLHLVLENMIFQTVSNPLITCLNLKWMSWVELLNDVIVIAGDRFDAPSIVEPTTAASYGVVLPNYNIGVLNTMESVHICGFYTGLRTAENTVADALGIYFCKYSIEFPFAYHPSYFQRFLDFWCSNGLLVTAANAFQIQQMDVERATTSWYNRAYDIIDTGNLATADVTWWTVVTGSGVLDQFDKNGGSGIKTRRIGGAY